VQQETYDGLPVHDYNVKRAADLRQRLFDTYQVSRIEDLPVNFRGVDYLEREAHANDMWQRHFAELWSTFDRQTTVHQLAGWFAPVMSVRALSMALAGVDVFHHQHFAMEAEAYRRQLVLKMNTQLAYGAGSQKRGAYTADRSFWSTVASFVYRQPDMAWALSNVRTGSIALLSWVAAACAALAFAVRRTVVD
jgi:ABC-2 type transport system permease protein